MMRQVPGGVGGQHLFITCQGGDGGGTLGGLRGEGGARSEGGEGGACSGAGGPVQRVHGVVYFAAH